MQEKDDDRLTPQPRLHGKFTAFGITFGQGLNAVPKHEQICDEHGDVGQLMAIDGNASGFIRVGGFVSQCVAHGGTGVLVVSGPANGWCQMCQSRGKERIERI